MQLTRKVLWYAMRSLFVSFSLFLKVHLKVYIKRQTIYKLFVAQWAPEVKYISLYTRFTNRVHDKMKASIQKDTT